MAQLKDDCFAFGGELLGLDPALALLRERVEPVAGMETVPLRACSGRILAEDVVAARDVPPHDNSAVDGYAVFFDDLKPGEETKLPVAGRVTAGHPLGRAPRRGEAIRIFTGAPMPKGPEGGPDTVYMEEDARTDGDAVCLPSGLKRGANRRKAGEDIRAGTAILKKGRKLRAQEIGLAASVGRSELRVHTRLRAAVFSTGDEVRDPGEEAPEGCIFDANRYAVGALLEGLGCRVTDLGILPDDLQAIRDALAKAAPDHDLLVTSAGVSAGEEDHVRAAVESLGRIHFWRLAIKPGRPIALGQVGRTAFVGLPGNPVAAMVTFMLIARPLVLRLAGAADTAPPLFRVRAGFDAKKKKGRREWLRARLVPNGADGLTAVNFRSSGAGILTSMVESDGLVELGEEIERVEKGAMVDFIPFSEVAR
ncbi:MAG: molybdopterin molybdenumtransferase MoeA [Rhodospirillales bacterium]|nr:molybdopterin molybdenumtransferase MoeA [Rhodospirillales bacterium]